MNIKTLVTLGFAILILSAVIALQAQSTDTHTANDFLFDRQSRLVMEYVETVMKRGDAADLLIGIRKTHNEIKNGQHTGNFDVIKVNLLTTIGTAESLIQEQQFPDNVDPEQFAADEAQKLNQWKQDVLRIMPDAGQTTEEVLAFPDTREVYNERKKDLLEEAYEMLTTLEEKMQ